MAACMYSKRQTRWLAFCCTCRAFTWKDTLGWRKMCWKIFSWSNNCGRKRRSRQLPPQRQRWGASEISDERCSDTDDVGGEVPLISWPCLMHFYCPFSDLQELDICFIQGLSTTVQIQFWICSYVKISLTGLIRKLKIEASVLWMTG